MELNRAQIDRTIDIMISDTSKAFDKLDHDVYIYSRDNVDDIISFIIDSQSILTGEQLQSVYETYNWNTYKLGIHLAERGFETGDIIMQIYYSQQYVYNKLMQISNYFVDIQYYEGCANIKKIISVLKDIEETNPYKKQKAAK